MKKLQLLIMQASYMLGLLSLLAGAVVRVAWHYHRALTYDPRSWFICAGTLFLCSLASYRISLLQKE